METIRNISLNTNNGSDFYVEVGNFLDAFYRAHKKDKIKMFADIPIDMSEPQYIPFLASATHKLANDFELPPPIWVFDKRCYLSGTKPYFAGNVKGKLRLWFMYKSPSEFKHRNLFVDENVLMRV